MPALRCASVHLFLNTSDKLKNFAKLGGFFAWGRLGAEATPETRRPSTRRASSWFSTACSNSLAAEWLSSHSRKTMFSKCDVAVCPTAMSAPSLAHDRIRAHTCLCNSTFTALWVPEHAHRTLCATMSTTPAVSRCVGISLALMTRSTCQGPRSLS
jgi:hypothetical protein